jgi:hypothetical protein
VVKRQRYGRATAVKRLWQWHLMEAALEHREGRRRGGVVRWRVAGALPFIGAGESNEVVRRGGGHHVKAAVMTVVKI